MKAYVVTTGALFGLLVLAHLWRLIEEGSHVAKDPWFVGFTFLAGGLALWAWRLVRLARRP
jgi:hypothetical protein